MKKNEINILIENTSSIFYKWIVKNLKFNNKEFDIKKLYESYVEDTEDYDGIKIRTFIKWVTLYGNLNNYRLKTRLSNGKNLGKFIDKNKINLYTSSKIYTQKEDLAILKWVEKSPDNLTYAFEQVAKELDLRKPSVAGRYYSYIRKHYNNTITCGSKKGVTNNIKNSKRDLINKPNDPPKQSLQPWLTVFHIFMDLNPQQQQAVKTLILSI